MPIKTTFVDLETAKTTRGLRLVVAANLPSPWSEAAKGIFRVKDVPYVAVKLEAMDKTVKQWTRTRNAPAVMYDDEPARSGWADILELQTSPGASTHSWESTGVTTSESSTTATGLAAFVGTRATCNEWTKRSPRFA